MPTTLTYKDRANAAHTWRISVIDRARLTILNRRTGALTPAGDQARIPLTALLTPGTTITRAQQRGTLDVLSGHLTDPAARTLAAYVSGAYGAHKPITVT